MKGIPTFEGENLTWTPSIGLKLLSRNSFEEFENEREHVFLVKKEKGTTFKE